MKTLKPLALHDIIGTSTEWTDELWNKALACVDESTGTMTEAVFMVERLPDTRRHQEYRDKTDCFREFRQYPPTVLLGCFDCLRSRRPY